MTRVWAAAVVLAAFALWEFAMPRRRYAAPRLSRWLSNLGLQAANALLLAAVLAGPALSLGALAERAELHRVGLLNLTRWSFPLKFALTIVLLDLAVWAQHWAFHAVPVLWRLHRVHHTDVDVDVATGLRFHPGETALSLAFKAAVVLLIGGQFLGVFVFELLLNAASIFTHANARIPFGMERWLRRVIVTPDMHRVHHSLRESERNSNFGFCLSCWDRLVGTYEADSAEGVVMMPLGLPDHRDAGKQTLPWLLRLPFAR
jgi:sterol desaturase/sphingolipid hydroxylase (fatty acid hydroxylase superfamily)